MPASKPQRPTPGAALTMPRVDDPATQRALDSLALVIQQLQAQLAVYTDTRGGTVPASGGGVVRFLRADGIWAVP